MPEGSTLYGQLPVCGGDELIIGPDDGEAPDRHKSCSKGFDDDGNPRCFLGPAIGVANNTPSLSTCVINALRHDLRGTMNAATGHAMLTVELASMTYATGDLVFGRCRGGLTPGKPCQREGVTPRDDCGVCVGGASAGNACQDDTTGQCVGGGNALQTCTDASDCPGGSCLDNCPGGACRGICADDVSAMCEGGANAGAACTAAVCGNGSRLGLPCRVDGGCDGGSCGYHDNGRLQRRHESGRVLRERYRLPRQHLHDDGLPGGHLHPSGRPTRPAVPGVRRCQVHPDHRRLDRHVRPGREPGRCVLEHGQPGSHERLRPRRRTLPRRPPGHARQPDDRTGHDGGRRRRHVLQLRALHRRQP